MHAHYWYLPDPADEVSDVKNHTSPELSQSRLTKAFLFSSRNWLGISPALPPSLTWLACNNKIKHIKCGTNSQ